MAKIYTIKVEGYNVGDRILEGVYFDVTVEVISATEHKVLDIKVVDEAKPYFEKLNKDMWLQKMKDSVEEDIYSVWENISLEEYDEAVIEFGLDNYAS